MDRRHVIRRGAIAIAIGMASLLPAAAQTKLVLKATDVHPLGYPTVEDEWQVLARRLTRTLSNVNATRNIF